MRKISESELKKRGIKLKTEDLGRISSSKSSRIISDVGKVMQETVKVLGQISKEISMENSMKNSKSPNVNTDIIKLIGQGKDGVQKVEIVGTDNKPKKWRVQVTGRDRNSLITEIIMEEICS